MKRPARPLAIGALGVALTLAVAHATTYEVVEVSAPIFPRVLVMYGGEGPSYPVTPAGREALVDGSALTYQFLRDECAGKGYSITLSDGGVLTAAELGANYGEVARCSYEQYTAKPYWIPQLLIDVDICGRTLGTGWRLLSEADLNGFRASDFQYLQDTLDAVAGGGSSWAPFYFSQRVYVAATDGGLVEGDLSPAATQRVRPLPPTVCSQCASYEESLKYHLEAGLSLRCIRRGP